MDTTFTESDSDRIRDALRLFNERHFFEAHEVLEEVWHRERGDPRMFLQGLIQICAGFHHYQNGNYTGAVDLLKRGPDKMRRYPRDYLGLDVAGLLRRVDEARGRIEELGQGREPSAPVEFPTLDLPP